MSEPRSTRPAAPTRPRSSLGAVLLPMQLALARRSGFFPAPTLEGCVLTRPHGLNDGKVVEAGQALKPRQELGHALSFRGHETTSPSLLPYQEPEYIVDKGPFIGGEDRHRLKGVPAHELPLARGHDPRNPHFIKGDPVRGPSSPLAQSFKDSLKHNDDC